MAITIDNVEYDETTLRCCCKELYCTSTGINNAIAKLKAEILNHEILIAHHSKNIKDNLPN